MAYITESRKSCYTEHVYIFNRFLLYATTISESQRINEKSKWRLEKYQSKFSYKG